MLSRINFYSVLFCYQIPYIVYNVTQKVSLFSSLLCGIFSLTGHVSIKHYTDRVKQKQCLWNTQKAQNQLICTWAKYHQDLCSSFVHSAVSNDSVSWQGRPWSDCAEAQSDLGLRCPHMPEEIFSHDAANIKFQVFACTYEGRVT